MKEEVLISGISYLGKSKKKVSITIDGFQVKIWTLYSRIWSVNHLKSTIGCVFHFNTFQRSKTEMIIKFLRLWRQTLYIQIMTDTNSISWFFIQELPQDQNNQCHLTYIFKKLLISLAKLVSTLVMHNLSHKLVQNNTTTQYYSSTERMLEARTGSQTWESNKRNCCMCRLNLSKPKVDQWRT
jgi:hypothetical protein